MRRGACERDAKSAGRPGSSSGQRHANGAGKQFMTTQVPGSGPDEDRDEGRDPQPQPVYDSVEAWVTGQFLPMYRRPLGGEYRWCRQWWQHAEAITRLTALWHSWEALRLEPGTGMAIWLRDHLDHQLPFCSAGAAPSPRAAKTSTSSPAKRNRLAPPAGGTPATRCPVEPVLGAPPAGQDNPREDEPT